MVSTGTWNFVIGNITTRLRKNSLGIVGTLSFLGLIKLILFVVSRPYSSVISFVCKVFLYSVIIPRKPIIHYKK